LGITLACLILGVYLFSSRVLLGGYADLERQEVSRNLMRVTDALRQQLTTMHRATDDWASWDDSYQFIRDRNQEYISSNLVTTSLKLDSLLYLDANGKVFYDRPVNRTPGVRPPNGETIAKLLHLGSPQASDVRGGVSGLVRYEGRLLMVSARPILPTLRNKPADGWLVFSLFFDQAEVESLSERTHVGVKIFDLDAPHLSPDCRAAYEKIRLNRATWSQPLDASNVAGYTLLDDIAGRPIKLLRIVDNRSIYKQGLATVRILTQFIVIAAIAFSIVIMVVLELSILSRVSKLSDQVKRVRDSQDPTTRVTLAGNDELSWLARIVDGMAIALQERRERLRSNNEALRRTIKELAATNSILEHVVEGISQIGADGRYTHVNTAYARMLQYPTSDLVGMHWESTIAPNDHEKFRVAVKQMEAGEKVEVEVQGRQKDGSTFHQEVVLIPDPTGVNDGGSYCFFKDITERKRLEHQVEHQAFHDALTGLPNRVLFIDRLWHAQARAHRSRLATAVLFLDLDNFKVINDSLGHDAGDALLKGIAERLKDCVRPADTVSRLGGDEFTIILEDLHDVHEATEVASRIVESLQYPIIAVHGNIFATASIGIAYSEHGNDDPDELLRDADTAMYQAKARGKCSFVVFDPSMNARAVERLELELGLRQAIEKEQFHLCYQPLVNLQTGEITGMEALLRWRHPERGEVSPVDFIPVAEETGLIHTIGEWVMREAFRQTREWQSLCPTGKALRVSVNLSGKQLQRRDIVSQVTGLLKETGLDPQLVQLEITESVLMEDMQDAARKLQSLRDLGVMLAIDDFGTGYSSMSSLSSFPVNTVKIDRTFVNRMGQENEVDAVVAAIVMLSKTMRLDITAEGVEELDQVLHLQALGCSTAQGYFFARPMTPEQFANRIKQGLAIAA